MARPQRTAYAYQGRPTKPGTKGICLSLTGLLLLLLAIRYLPFGREKASKYVVVFDAGSTGSRVHIFHFKTTSGSSQLQLLGDEFQQVKPGLSSYAGSPSKAAASIDGLLKLAVEAVPPAQRASTPCILRATAGLRQLEGTQSDDILAAVLKLIQESPFAVTSDSVSILDGQDEGAFAWLTLNYLKGNLGKPARSTATTIDLGGGSVQVSYAVDESPADAGLAEYFTNVQGGGMEYKVYVHSYLGFGLMAARAGILDTSAEGSACLPQGFLGQYPYGGTQHAARPTPKGSSGSQCRDSIIKVLEPKSSCDGPSDQCSFHGAWGGPGLSADRDLFLFSYFWDRALDLGIIKKGAIDGTVALDEFNAASNKICTLGFNEVQAQHSDVENGQAPYLCMDLSYCSSLLTDGFGLSGTLKANLVKQVIYEGTPYEIAWALGAAINVLG